MHECKVRKFEFCEKPQIPEDVVFEYNSILRNENFVLKPLLNNGSELLENQELLHSERNKGTGDTHIHVDRGD